MALFLFSRPQQLSGFSVAWRWRVTTVKASKKNNSDSCQMPISIIGYFSDMSHLTTLSTFVPNPWGFYQKTLTFRQTLFFDWFELKFAHAILRIDLIAYYVTLILFAKYRFRSHKAFTVMTTWSGQRQDLGLLLNSKQHWENFAGVAMIVIRVYKWQECKTW